jgi:hypothetical protein
MKVEVWVKVGVHQEARIAVEGDEPEQVLREVADRLAASAATLLARRGGQR